MPVAHTLDTLVLRTTNLNWDVNCNKIKSFKKRLNREREKVRIHIWEDDLPWKRPHQILICIRSLFLQYTLYALYIIKFVRIHYVHLDDPGVFSIQPLTVSIIFFCVCDEHLKLTSNNINIMFHSNTDKNFMFTFFNIDLRI